MSEQNSILDKIIQSSQNKEAVQFDPSEVVANLFKNISAKEQDILNRRFGLFNQPRQTLEQIGQHYKITRERIRQIEVGTIKKLKTLENFRQQIEAAERNIVHLLEKYGGIMEENNFINELLAYAESPESNRPAALFITSHLLADKLEPVKPSEHFLSGWKLPTLPLDIVETALVELVKIIEQENTLMATEKLINKFLGQEFFQKNRNQLLAAKLGAEPKTEIDREIQTIIQSFLTISKKIDQNILGEWGLSHWQTVSPRRMSDKAYLVLRQAGKPLHFTAITQLINQAGFDRKVAYPATIHNELILDDHYVLVGRGIYALKEWGYKPGTVIDIIREILRQSPQPLTKEEIVQRVLEQRLVRKSTIYLALANKAEIKKLPEGRYILV